MKTILDVDYYSLILSGNGGVESIRRVLNDAKSAGVDTILWAPMVGGKANFPSKVTKRFHQSRMHAGGHHLDDVVGKIDPLAVAAEACKEMELDLLFYFRLFDDYFPGMEEDYFESNPHLWWQSRCGLYQFRGWPCYHEPEVRAHKMRLFRELLQYGPDGFMIEVSRSHSWYANPQRGADYFGYNAPVAEEFYRRHGVDIREFKHFSFLSNAEGLYGSVPYVYQTTYVEPQEFDVEAWHWLKGEAVSSFAKQLRASFPAGKFLLQGGLCPPHPFAVDEGASAKFYIDPNALAADGTVDGYSFSRNFKTVSPEAIREFYFPYFDGVRSAGKPVGVWLNDIVTADGGAGQVAELADIERYVAKIRAAEMDFVVIHEADFVDRHPQREAVWKLIRQFAD